MNLLQGQVAQVLGETFRKPVAADNPHTRDAVNPPVRRLMCGQKREASFILKTEGLRSPP